MLSSIIRYSKNVALQVTAPLLRTSREPTAKISSNILKVNSLTGQRQINRYFNFNCFSSCTVNVPVQNQGRMLQSSITMARPLLQTFNLLQTQKRTVTKFSLKKGKRKTVKVALTKFKRLNWGIWIHAKCGREKKLYKKSANRRRRLRQHVFCNASQSFLLDKMVTKYWRKPRHYVDDPYEPYHSREDFYITRKEPITPLS